MSKEVIEAMQKAQKAQKKSKKVETTAIVPAVPVNRVKYVGVQFPGNQYEKEYVYKHDIELQEGDLVVVDSSNGLGIAKVSNIHPDPKQATRWVVQKIDMESHNKRLEIDRQRMSIRRQMDERRKVLEDEALYRMMAERDPEMAKLIEQFYSL